MPGLLGELYIQMTWPIALQIAMLGFIGGILSGFIGSGGAFFMTPGMMNLGVMGPRLLLAGCLQDRRSCPWP